MAELKELQKLTPFEKLPDGTIFVNVGGELEDRGPIDGLLSDPHRNLCSVIYPPVGGAWTLTFECDGITREVAKGVVDTPEVGKKSAVVIRTRVQRDANPPREP